MFEEMDDCELDRVTGGGGKLGVASGDGITLFGSKLGIDPGIGIDQEAKIGVEGGASRGIYPPW